MYLDSRVKCCRILISLRTSAFDKNTQMDKPLTAEELDIIRRLQENENPDAGYDPYEPTVEWFTGKGKEEIMPLSAAPEPKRRWVPSKWEKQKVSCCVRYYFCSPDANMHSIGNENSPRHTARPHTSCETKIHKTPVLCYLERGAIRLRATTSPRTETPSPYERRIV
jgi:BOP1NT (NUC169) domain